MVFDASRRILTGLSEKTRRKGVHPYMYDYLEEFVAIARAGSLSAAASSAGLSQPALSRHLAALEAQLETALVVRGPSGVQLTPEGRYALDTALDVAALERSIELHLADPDRRRRERRIRVVALDAFPTAAQLLAHACTELNADEGLDLELRRADFDLPRLPLAELLERRLVDAAVGFGGALARNLRQSECTVVTLMDIPGVAVLSPTHRLAGRQRIELADLRSCRIVRKPSSQYESAGSWEELRLAYERAGFTPLAATRPPGGSWDLVPPDTNEVEITLRGGPEIGRRVAAGQRILPVDGLSFPVAVALRADDETVRRTVERAHTLANGTVRPIPISHRSGLATLIWTVSTGSAPPS